MSRFAEYATHDAISLAALIRSGAVSAGEVLEEAIARVDAGDGNPRLNAIVWRCDDAARARARAPLPDSPLAGVPFLIKELTSMAGLPATQGSRLYAEDVATTDATIVGRYRAAGLVLFGKTNAPEFGLAATTEPQLFGPARNPWQPACTPGGSSGGAAAAVAAGWVPAAHASDGGGSIRIPASCCGLVGLKPTRARTPLGPDVGEGWGGMSTAHVVSRSVRDSAAFLDAAHGAAPGDPYRAPPFSGSWLREHATAPRRLRIALDVNALTGARVHADCIAAAEQAARLCAQLGHDVEIASPAFDREAFGRAASTVVAANIANMVFGRVEARGRPLADGEVEAYTRWFADIGAGVRADVYVRALRTLHQTGRALAAFHERFDVLLTPTLVGPPVRVGYLDTNALTPEEYGRRFREFWGFTNLQNATGAPAISLPLHRNTDGLPIGVQFAAAPGEELLLLQLAHTLEATAPWPTVATARAAAHADASTT